jgi:glycosyltransferase involved in cell wall biosynthesis
VESLPETLDDRPRNRFGYFGQFTPFKGADVLLQAVAILGDEFDGHLYIHGANLDTQSVEFQERFGKMLDDAGENVTVVGQYQPSELPSLMAQVDWVVVPSIWWETGPLTVPEAFQHGRPVICSNMGGMSEKVTDNVNGLYFRRRDPYALADVMKQAMRTPGLWEELREGIPPLRRLDERMGALIGHYRRLIAAREPASADGDLEREPVRNA